MKNPFVKLLIRWFVCGLGLWIAAAFAGGSISYQNKVEVVVLAGLILALVNMIIRPILIIFALPAILFTLGLFLIIINGATVFLTSIFYEPLEITSFWAAIFAGIVIGVVNYLVTTVLEDMGNRSAA